MLDGVWGNGPKGIVKVRKVSRNPPILRAMPEELKKEGVVAGGDVLGVFFINECSIMGESKVKAKVQRVAYLGG